MFRGVVSSGACIPCSSCGDRSPTVWGNAPLPPWSGAHSPSQVFTRRRKKETSNEELVPRHGTFGPKRRECGCGGSSVFVRIRKAFLATGSESLSDFPSVCKYAVHFFQQASSCFAGGATKDVQYHLHMYLSVPTQIFYRLQVAVRPLNSTHVRASVFNMLASIPPKPKKYLSCF